MFRVVPSSSISHSSGEKTSRISVGKECKSIFYADIIPS